MYEYLTVSPHRYAVFRADNNHYIGQILRTPAYRRARDRQWTYIGAQADYPTREIAAHHLAAKRWEPA